MSRESAFIFLLTLMIVPAGALKVGVFPGVKNLGTVERGETVWIDILLVGGQPGTEVRIKQVRPPVQSFATAGYGFRPENASQMSIDKWIEINDRKVTLEEQSSFRIENRVVTGNKRVTYILRVPESAEPGYYKTYIKPVIAESGDVEGTGFTNQAVAQHNLIFRVPGRAIRDAKILGFSAERVGRDTAAIKTIVQNTGTVTITARVESR
ncbi:MAG: hypothetical protein ABEJ72_09920, partial [Candidatus Aenigmatarchaeota archaeon]